MPSFVSSGRAALHPKHRVVFQVFLFIMIVLCLNWLLFVAIKNCRVFMWVRTWLLLLLYITSSPPTITSSLMCESTAASEAVFSLGNENF